MLTDVNRLFWMHVRAQTVLIRDDTHSAHSSQTHSRLLACLMFTCIISSRPKCYEMPSSRFNSSGSRNCARRAWVTEEGIKPWVE